LSSLQLMAWKQPHYVFITAYYNNDVK